MNPEKESSTKQSAAGKKWPRVAALAVALLLIAGTVAAGRFWHHAPKSGSQTSSGDSRKILYWYDAMNPGNHYDKPGTAPDGMALVPQYAEASATPAGHGAGPAAGQKKILYWYDPMHPAYRSDKPGIAPDCGMQLVPMYEGDGSAEKDSITIAPQRQQMLGVRFTDATADHLTRDLRANGSVAADDSRISHIHVRATGYVEQAFVNYTGQLVRTGQPLFTYYSPDLVAAQQEYLIAKRGADRLGNSQYPDAARSSKALLDAAQARLRQWNLTEKQLRQLEQSGTASRTLTVYADHGGYVIDRKVYPNAQVTPDMDLYTISDLSRLWVIVDIYEQDLPYVRVGQSVDFSPAYAGGRAFHGRVSYIFPSLDPQTHTAKVRVDVANPGMILRPNMFVDVTLQIDYGHHVTVPSEAVLDSGRMQSVFVVHDGNRFEPREVKVGPQVGDRTIILGGLKAGETVVSSGNFLIDSESRMKSASGAMQK